MFFAVVQQLLYLITDPSACQQLFYFLFAVFETVIRFAVSSIILAFSNRIVN